MDDGGAEGRFVCPFGIGEIGLRRWEMGLREMGFEAGGLMMMSFYHTHTHTTDRLILESRRKR